MERLGLGSLRRGQVVNARYRVEELIGRGGMSQVVSATDLNDGRRVALKLPHAERARSAKDLTRIAREARAIDQLASPHAARLLDTGTLVDDGLELPYLVLEYVDGVDLATWLGAQRRLDPTTAATIVWQACDAIGEAHARGLVHRDVKPANLMLTASPAGALVVKVLDFGIARECEARERLTRTGELLGSPTYMAPEQMRPTAAVDARADVWALGVVLFEAIAGRLPFEASSLPDLCLSVLLDEPAPLPDDASAELAAIVGRCLAKQPGARYASARELADALRPFAAPSLPISPTDLELAAIDAAARDRDPAGDAVDVEVGSDRDPAGDAVDVEATADRERRPRRWWRAGGVAAALVSALALALGLGLAVHGRASGGDPHAARVDRQSPPRPPQRTAPPAANRAPPPVQPPTLPRAPIATAATLTALAPPPIREAPVTRAKRARTKRRAPRPVPIVAPAVTTSPPHPAPARARDPLASPF